MAGNKKTNNRKKKIPAKKLNAVKELTELAKNKKTILIASIKNIPAAQFQEISKKLRGKAVVRVPKKRITLRVLDSIDNDNEQVKNFKGEIKEDTAILFSDEDGFELANELIENKKPAKAKAGQIAPEEIIVKAGATDLPPGPAISELGALGIVVGIEKGKVMIKADKVIVKKNEPISQNAVDIMNKLDIKPFSIGFIPLAIFDLKESKIYTNIKIDKQAVIAQLKDAYAKARAFGVEIAYTTPETIKFLIQKAGRQELAISSIINASETKSGEESK